MAFFPKRLLVTASLLTFGFTTLPAASQAQQVQIKPPLIRSIDPPAKDATAADLEMRADKLRAEKLYLDALDYYRAALEKQPHSASLLNKIGITELMMQRYREAKKSFEQVDQGKQAGRGCLQQPGCRVLRATEVWSRCEAIPTGHRD